MHRFEFLHFVFFAAKAAHLASSEDIVEAVETFLSLRMEQYIAIPILKPNDSFRRERLYHKDVEHLLKKHLPTLKLIFLEFTADEQKKNSYPMIDLHGWLALLKDASFIDGDFTIREAVMAFVFSRMAQLDEVSAASIHSKVHSNAKLYFEGKQVQMFRNLLVCLFSFLPWLDL